MLYGKIIDNELVYAPESYTFSSGLTVTNFNSDINLMTDMGFREVTNTGTPVDTRFEYTERYEITEDNKILVIYEMDNSLQILDDLKYRRIKRTKDDLAIYLHENPLISYCKNNIEKSYTVTFDKQNQLFAKINDYITKALPKMLVNEVVDIKIAWNAQGEMSELWTYDEVCILKDEIMNYVNPIIEYQRHLEEEIRKQTSQDGIYNLDCYFEKDKIDNFINNLKGEIKYVKNK